MNRVLSVVTPITLGGFSLVSIGTIVGLVAGCLTIVYTGFKLYFLLKDRFTKKG